MHRSIGWWTLVATLLYSTAAAAQRTVPINIHSSPAGAQVFLDAPQGAAIGITPMMNQRVPRGPHTLYFKLDGYEDAQLPVVAQRRRETFIATLRALGRIELTPGGDGSNVNSVVSVNGQNVGTLPHRGFVRPGRHLVQISQPGFQPLSTWAEIAPGQTWAQVIVLERERPRLGSLLIAGDVPGAQVFVDGRPRGTSPVVIDDLSPGPHTVEIRAEGIEPWSQAVAVQAGERTSVNPTLRPVRPTGGTIRVLANVAGAQVAIDGEAIGPAPISSSNLPPGTHILDVIAPGHRAHNQEVTVVAGQHQVVRVELQVLPPEEPVASLRVVSPMPNAQVFLDGQAVGEVPFERSDIAVGTHYVTVRLAGFADWTRTVSLQQNARVELRAELNPVATIRIRANVSGAMVYLGSQALGRTPFESSGVQTGNHRLLVRLRGYRPHEETITLAPGETRDFNIELLEITSGPSLAERTRIRETMMPFSAGLIYQNMVATDVGGGYPYYAEFRMGVGIEKYVDAGIMFRTTFYYTEIAVRARVGVRPLQAIGLGADLMAGGVLGPDGRDGLFITPRAAITLYFTDRGAFTVYSSIPLWSDYSRKFNPFRTPDGRQTGARIMLGFDLEYIFNPLVNVYVGIERVMTDDEDTTGGRGPDGFPGRLMYVDMPWGYTRDPLMYLHAGLTLKY